MRMIHVLRKPLSEGTVAANTLKHGTGGINIDASRISTTDNLNGGAYAENASERHDGAENWRYKRGEQGNAGEYQPPSGRWPANVILQHLDGCQCAGTRKVRCKNPTRADGTIRHGDNEIYGKRGGIPLSDTNYAGPDGKETVTNWVCEPGCPVARLDADTDADKGGASRFFKQVGGSGEKP